MKKTFFLISLILLSSFVCAQEKDIMTFTETTHDFGTVHEESGRVSYVFTFTNNSMTPITLRNVKASCGCTTPEWSKEPVKPGETGKITVSYATKGRPGTFQKSITITANAGVNDFTKRIYIKGQVVPASTTELVPIKKNNA